MDISPGPRFWRRIPGDMAIPLLDHLALSGRPDTDIDGAAVNFASTAFPEVHYPLATPNQRQDYSLVAHAPKEAVNGEVVSRLGPAVGLLVGIPVRHALTGNGLYDFVWAHVQRYATVIVRSLVRTKRYRP